MAKITVNELCADGECTVSETHGHVKTLDVPTVEEIRELIQNQAPQQQGDGGKAAAALEAYTEQLKRLEPAPATREHADALSMLKCDGPNCGPKQVPQVIAYLIEQGKVARVDKTVDEAQEKAEHVPPWRRDDADRETV